MIRHIPSDLFSEGEGIFTNFSSVGKKFHKKSAVKGHLFHYVYQFGIDFDGKRRFHPRQGREIDNYEVLVIDHFSNPIEIIPARQLFTVNQLLNKEDRILEGLNKKEYNKEMSKKY